MKASSKVFSFFTSVKYKEKEKKKKKRENMILSPSFKVQTIDSTSLGKMHFMSLINGVYSILAP